MAYKGRVNQRSPATPAPIPGPRARADRLRRWTYLALSPFWVVPAAWCLVSVGLGLLAPQADEHVRALLPFLFDGGAAGARAVLSTVAGAMISVTGLVFSITIVVLQLASSQFSPRVLRTFLESRVTQHTLGVFAGSFLYSLTVLRSVVDTPGSHVPQVGVTLAYLWVLGAVAMFLAFIHHITQAISVTTVIRRAADETRVLVSRGQDEATAHPERDPVLPALGPQSVAVATRSGYLDTIDQGILCELAVKHDVRVEVLHPLGTFVPVGAPIAVVHGDPVGPDWDHRVGRGLGLTDQRSMQQDLSFGIRRLVDIAERALSPGVNDPTTAVQVLDQLHDLLRQMAVGRDSYPVRYDASGVARLVMRDRTLPDYLDLALDEIAHYGADSLQIPRRIDEMLLDLGAAATPQHRGAIAAKSAELAIRIT